MAKSLPELEAALSRVAIAYADTLIELESRPYNLLLHFRSRMLAELLYDLESAIDRYHNGYSPEESELN